VVSIVAAVVTIGLKFGAYLLTGSVGLFSDAAESVVNLVAAVTALWALTLAARPPDEEHAFGHNKAEYFSSGLESALILIAAGWIAATAVPRLFEPEPLQNVGVGLAVTLVAAAINGGVALVILRAGRRLRSITLEADARHLLTDVWTSVGVVLASCSWAHGLARPRPANSPHRRRQHRLDRGAAAARHRPGFVGPGAAGGGSGQDPEGPLPLRGDGHPFPRRPHPLAGQRRFISMHVLVPGGWTVKRGHDLAEEIENDIARDLPQSTFFVHVEPAEDPASFADQALDRERSEGPDAQKEGRTG
jgi:divalent metal cation (Fe/Co/Zn/Cd) transporter